LAREATDINLPLPASGMPPTTVRIPRSSQLALRRRT
jgi:hypothetical protein